MPEFITYATPFWTYITSPEGAQYSYIGVVFGFFFLAIDVKLGDILAKREVVVKPGTWRHNVFVFSCALIMFAFFLSISITGAHPRFSRDTVTPFSRFVWFVIDIPLLGSTLVDLYWHIIAMYAKAKDTTVNVKTSRIS